jgi:hypothetical protein
MASVQVHRGLQVAGDTTEESVGFTGGGRGCRCDSLLSGRRHDVESSLRRGKVGVAGNVERLETWLGGRAGQSARRSRRLGSKARRAGMAATAWRTAHRPSIGKWWTRTTRVVMVGGAGRKGRKVGSDNGSGKAKCLCCHDGLPASA